MREPSSSSTSPASLAPRRLLTLALVLVLVAQLLAPIAGFSSIALADDATPTAATTTDATTASTDIPTPEPTLAPTDTPAPLPTDTPTQAPVATDTPAPQPTATDAPIQPTATDAPAAQPTNPPTKTITGTPTITSDKADYGPGDLVTLTGSNWQPGEIVHIYVNDDKGSTWSRNVDVTADDNGAIIDSFNLPNWFVATYTVVATGPQSGQVTFKFTDSNVKIQNAATTPSGVGATFKVENLTDKAGVVHACSDTYTDPNPASATVVGPSALSGGLGGAGASDRVRITVSGVSAGYALSGITIGTSTLSMSGGVGCWLLSSGDFNGGTATFTASYIATQQSQTISFGTISDKTYGDSDFDPGATASSGLAVTYTASGNCSIVSGKVRITGAGSCTVTASQAGNASYSAATDVQRSFNIAKATPAITWANPAAITYGTALSATQLNATASVPGSFVYTPASGTVLNAGSAQTLHVAFTPTDTANYNGASKDVSITVNKADQTVTFTSTAPTAAKFNDTYTPVATGGASGNSVTFGASGACSISSGVVKMTGVGTCTVTADQAGNDNYNAAAQQTQVFSVGKANQAALTVDSPNAGSYNQHLTMTASGGTTGGTITFAVVSGSTGCAILTAGVDIGKLAITNGIGSCSITATMAGNTNYNDVTSAAHVVAISKASQTITFDQPATPAVYGTMFHVAPTSDSALPVSAAVTGDANVCEVAPALGGGYDVTMMSGTGDCVLTASQAGDDNYEPATSVDRTVAAAKKDQTITFDPLDGKTYGDADFGVSATASSGMTVGFTVGTGDNCTISGSTVHITGAGSCTVTASQAGNANYNAAPAVPQTFSIAQKGLTISGAVAQDKTYDGGSGATVDFSQASLFGVVGTDQVSINFSGYSASFSDKNVGVNKAVTVTGVALSGANAGNYTVAQPSGLTASITVKGLTVTGITASDKIYDGGTNATLNTSSVILVGVVSGDTVSLVTTSASGAFGDKTVETGKAVTVSGLALSGADKDNYSLTQPTTTASIFAKELTINGLAASDKTYDGSDVAAITGAPVLVGAVNGDSVSLTGTAAGTFDSKDAGANKTVTVSGLSLAGADKDNYTLTLPTLTATISKAGLTISGAAAQDKVYDRTLAATVDFSHASLSGVVSDENVTIDSSAYRAAFATASVGNGKAVTVTGVALGGADAGNYTVAQPSGLTANITKLGITGSFTASNKIYDGTTDASVLMRSVNGVIADDTVNLSGGTASFADKNVGTGKTVTLTGASLSGADAGNYSLTSVSTTTANITAATVTGSFTASDKIYDGTTAATITGRTLAGVVPGDVVSLTGGVATFDTKDPGIGKTVTGTGFTLTGTDAVNYVLASTTLTTTASITYGFAFLQPINYTAHQTSVTPGTSVFKAGSTIPVKFSLYDAFGNVLPCQGTAQWLGYVKVSTNSSGVNETTSTDTPMTSGVFTCSSGVYQYNWSTKNVGTGYYYKISVLLPDGEQPYVYIGLK